MTKIWLIIRDWVEIITASLIIVFLVKTFLFTTYIVPSSSMEPFIKKGSRIIVNRLSKNFKRGELAAFNYPLNHRLRMVKRVIGLSNDKLELKDNTVIVGKEKFDYQKIDFLRIDPDNLEELNSITVPENSYYMLGDNINNSKDSRFWGFVNKSEIIGKVIMIYWPLRQIRVLR
ncbi:MAG: signal peptidase I [Candidatus Muirbacterium halophilum]|nr:signal peptidase I [Candidatus Muirbacterium halophilum]MCK9474913.1 signal peptidase I [Candidatus Muirbacterium halophilum]